jgi:hypothetical protein
MLIGINCPFLGKVSLEECLACATRHENKCETPSEVIRGILAVQEERGTMISPSALTGCIRKSFLKNTNDYYDSLDQLYWSFRGQLAHSLLEKYQEEGAVVEKRLTRTLANGITISGKPDAYYPKLNLLRDWKTSRAVPKYNKPYDNHNLQVNMYRYILAKPDNEAPVPIDEIKVTYLSMDATKTVPAMLMSDRELEDILLNGSEMLKDAFDNGVVPVVPKEYPNYPLCKYCPSEIREKCSEVFRMGRES